MALIEPNEIVWIIERANKQIRQGYTQPSHQIVTEPSQPLADNIKGVENLKLFINAKDLWEEIKPMLASSEFFLLVINGPPGSGKTDLARQFACLAHTYDGFTGLHYTAFKALEMPATVVENAKGAKKVLIVLDDMSYALASVSNKQASKFKNWITQIRHALKTEQVFVIVIGHFTTAVPPVMKNSNIWIFPSPTTQEQDAMIKVVGRSQKNRKLFETVFNAVRQIQAVAKPKETLEIKVSGKARDFTWDVDGRLGLLLKNGESFVFHSKQDYCAACAQLGKSHHIDSAFYAAPEDTPAAGVS